MAPGNRRAIKARELGRGERVMAGLFRLRLPLPLPGVPHCNAWAISAGDGLVLVDTGMHQPGSMQHLERAMQMCSLEVDDVRLVVCTHAHADHYGQAATIVGRTGCELWMHPNIDHMRRIIEDPDAELARRVEIARQSGVPSEPLRRYADSRSPEPRISGLIEPDRELLDGVRVQSDLGEWIAYETPGHDPSHVCLFQPERRLLISGDHLLGRISPYFDFGYSPDPVGEFLSSLDVVERLDARLCLSGHGRTFTDTAAHIAGNRELVARHTEMVEAAVAGGPVTAFQIISHIFAQTSQEGPLLSGGSAGSGSAGSGSAGSGSAGSGSAGSRKGPAGSEEEAKLQEANAAWLLVETLALLRHLEVSGRVRQVDGLRTQAGQQLWVAN